MKINVKCSVNVLDKDFFGSAGIKLDGSFFLATLLVVTKIDFEAVHGSFKHALYLLKFYSRL